MQGYIYILFWRIQLRHSYKTKPKPLKKIKKLKTKSKIAGCLFEWIWSWIRVTYSYEQNLRDFYWPRDPKRNYATEFILPRVSVVTITRVRGTFSFPDSIPPLNLPCRCLNATAITSFHSIFTTLINSISVRHANCFTAHFSTRIFYFIYLF